jgi:asparagine synthase (glutamine-hydrolysing)
MEGPVGGFAVYGYWRNAGLAAEHAIKVLLDGQGADQIFAGYRYYYELKIRQLWQQGR